ncbi:hypothetical protein [Streptomyces sp. NPDC101455]|uniref:hypothetical protein n=1 Tax=Streptomyces sp. NPDC101455 TaxID=3366142 RepID=UPI003821B716
MAEALLRLLGREHPSARREHRRCPQLAMPGWGVAVGTAAAGSTDPMPPLPSAV